MKNLDYHHPDEWVILKIRADDDHSWYRVFGSWFGNYAIGDNWRANSGIAKYAVHDSYIEFYGTSGSIYRCDIEFEGVRSRYNSSVLNDFLDSDHTEVISFEEFIKEFGHAAQ